MEGSEIPIQGNVTRDPEVLSTYSRDASIFRVVPSHVAIPRSAEDIQQLVRYATKHRDEGVSLTVRSGGTDMSGGPLSESVVIDVQKHLNKVLRVGNGLATTQPGTWYRDFEKETLRHNLLLPSYPASREICTVGGMVNNNSGGEKTLAYGKTEDYVKELKVVLADGNEYSFQALDRQQLQEKLSLPSFEGDVYRRTFEMLEQHYDAIKKAKPNVTKNSTGYSLWNVWDKKTFNLAQLFVGSQGTLGITTEITFRLIPPKPHARMLVIFLRNLDPLAAIVQTVLRYSPESFESYDDHTLSLALRFFPKMIKKMGTSSAFGMMMQFLPELQLILTGGLPKLVLIAEFTGHDPDEVQKRAYAAQAAMRQYNVKTRVTKTEQEGKKYWAIRRESFNLLRSHVQHKHTAPFIDDCIVRPDVLPQFLPKLHDILEQYNITYTIAGHVGDANFHIIPLMDLTQQRQRDIIPELSKKVYDLVFSFGGSMSGEHNDGLIRSTFLKQMYGEDIYDLFVETKRIFDPHNIFNPGKKVDASWDFAMNHMIRE